MNPQPPLIPQQPAPLSNLQAPNINQAFQPMPQQAQVPGQGLGLHPAHNAIYEKVRQLLMNLHGQGVPGMDQVLSALNGQHVKLMGGQKQPMGRTNSQPTPPASPQNPTPQGYYGQ